MAIFLNSTRDYNSIKGLYIFGDSLSDVGNVSRVMGSQYPPTPPYFSGRYSNGQLWVEYLQQQLQLSPKQVVNLAWGGATAGNNFSSVPSLLEQVKNFTPIHNVNSQALCLILIGANDYLYGTTNVVIPIENIVKAISSLSQFGVQYFLIGNLPDLGQLPATRNSPISNSLSVLTNLHNLSLSKSIQHLKHQANSELKIIEFDVYSLYKEVKNNPAKFGLNNVDDSCITNSSVCCNPESFLFWDGIHPTGVAHQILGKRAYEQLEEAKFANRN